MLKTEKMFRVRFFPHILYPFSREASGKLFKVPPMVRGRWRVEGVGSSRPHSCPAPRSVRRGGLGEAMSVRRAVPLRHTCSAA